ASLFPSGMPGVWGRRDAHRKHVVTGRHHAADIEGGADEGARDDPQTGVVQPRRGLIIDPIKLQPVVLIGPRVPHGARIWPHTCLLLDQWSRWESPSEAVEMADRPAPSGKRLRGAADRHRGLPSAAGSRDRPSTSADGTRIAC